MNWIMCEPFKMYASFSCLEFGNGFTALNFFTHTQCNLQSHTRNLHYQNTHSSPQTTDARHRQRRRCLVFN
jgi:hypothetical protein